MTTNATVVFIELLCALLFPFQVSGEQSSTAASETPGEVERAALRKVAFLLGEWEGEGWSLSASGGHDKFWIKEFYRYRGDRDLMDMEGRFRDIRPDGTKSPKEDYALGILFFDRANKEYRMWHYSGNGTVFTVKMDIDIKAKTAQYERKNARGDLSRFSLGIGKDGIWVSKIELLQPDNTWLKVLEFRMRRVR